MWYCFRTPALALFLGLFLPGCTDSLGIGADCSAAKQRVRWQEGTPDRTEKDELAGNFRESWYYFDSGEATRVYTFRWGPAYETCEMEGPRRFARVPV